MRYYYSELSAIVQPNGQFMINLPHIYKTVFLDYPVEKHHGPIAFHNDDACIRIVYIQGLFSG